MEVLAGDNDPPAQSSHGNDDHITFENGVYRVLWSMKRSLLRKMEPDDRQLNLQYVDTDDDFFFEMEFFLKDCLGDFFSLKIKVHGLESLVVHCAVSAVNYNNELTPLAAAKGKTYPESIYFPEILKKIRIREDRIEFGTRDVLKLCIEVRISKVRVQMCRAVLAPEGCDATSPTGDAEVTPNGDPCGYLLLRANNKTYRVNAKELARSSDAFKKIIENMKMDGVRNCLEISGMNDHSLLVLLHYLQSGTFPVLDVELAKYLVMAARFFRLNDLLFMCLEYLKAQICEANVMDLLFFASSVSNEGLLEECAEFIRRPDITEEGIKKWRSILHVYQRNRASGRLYVVV